MFRVDNAGSHGFLSILFAPGDDPLVFFDKQVRSGSIKRVVDETDKGKLQCIELLGANIATTFVSSPTIGHTSLGITLPVLVLIVKNLRRFFSYQVQILDDKNCRRRFRMTTVPGFNRRQATVSTFPLVLEEGWNELATNLSDICHRVYGTQYIETTRLEICANCRLREVFFCESFDSMKSRTQKDTQFQYTSARLQQFHQLNPAMSLFPFMDSNLNTGPNNHKHDSGSIDYDYDETDPKGNLVQEARRVLTEYEDLANKVKRGIATKAGGTGPELTITPRSIMKTTTLTMDKIGEKRRDRSNFYLHNNISGGIQEQRNNDAAVALASRNNSSQPESEAEAQPKSTLSLGERLKRDMYFEKEKPLKSNASKFSRESRKK